MIVLNFVFPTATTTKKKNNNKKAGIVWPISSPWGPTSALQGDKPHVGVLEASVLSPAPLHPPSSWHPKALCPPQLLLQNCSPMGHRPSAFWVSRGSLKARELGETATMPKTSVPKRAGPRGVTGALQEGRFQSLRPPAPREGDAGGNAQSLRPRLSHSPPPGVSSHPTPRHAESLTSCPVPWRLSPLGHFTHAGHTSKL